jgi:hypothetical protein
LLSTLTARHPKPAAIEAISSPGRSSPGTLGVFSSASCQRTGGSAVRTRVTKAPNASM